MLTNDEIVRDMVLRAPPTRVWDALTKAEHLARWFGTGAEVDLRPGGRISFEWEQYQDQAPGEIEEVDRPRRFVFRWHPFGHLRDLEVDPSLRTRVEFDLEEHPEGTRLRVRESGFASLPEAIAARSRGDNTSGWDAELAELREYVEGPMAP
jgi:uncharacterized protein YndB with AHSA1/START domain